MERIMRLKLKGSQLSVSQWAHGRRVINIWVQGRNTERLRRPSEFHSLFATSDFRHSQEGNHAKNVQYSMKDITWKNLSKSHIDRVNWGYYFDYVYLSKSYSYVG